MRLSGYTKPFAVLGHPIGHTLSPVMHNASFRSLNLDSIYLAFDVDPANLMSVLESMNAMGFAGVNLTIPLKEVAFKNLERLDDSARLVGAVNTVAFTDEGLVGHNTDGYGFLKAIDEAFDAGMEGRRVLVLGTGGAGRAVALVAARAGAGEIVLADLDATRILQVMDELEALDCGVKVSSALSSEAQEAAAIDVDFIVQATPVGMKEGDPSLLGPSAFREGQRVFDLVYMYPETPLLKTAKEAGAQTANGLGMLLHQGAKAFSIWTGTEADVEVMRTALEEVVYAT